MKSSKSKTQEKPVLKKITSNLLSDSYRAVVTVYDKKTMSVGNKPFVYWGSSGITIVFLSAVTDDEAIQEARFVWGREYVGQRRRIDVFSPKERIKHGNNFQLFITRKANRNKRPKNVSDSK